MASLADLLQRIARSLEEARERGPADDLRARLGYGTGDEDDDEPAEDFIRESPTEAARTGASDREPEPGAARTWPTGREPETAAARSRPTDRMPETTRRPASPRLSAQSAAVPRAYGPGRAPPAADPPRHRRSSPSAPPSSLAAAGVPLPERIRARVRTPDALREAFVVKEILDRPLARRRPGPGMR